MLAVIGVLVLMSPVEGSWREVGQRNFDTVQELSSLFTETMQGLQITPALMAKLSQKMMSYYAPKVSCLMAKNSAFEVDLRDVSVAQCFMAMGSTGKNVMWLNFAPKNTAIDPASGGSAILVYSVLDMVGVSSTGEHVPGTHIHGMVSNSRYMFNEDGKIQFMESEFDSGALQADNHMVLRYESMKQIESRRLHYDAMNLASPSIVGDWKGVGVKNIETIQRINNMAKEIQGKQLSKSLFAKMSEEMMAFYAPKISCRFWKKSAMAVNLDNVPVASCFTALGRFGSYIKNLDFVVENVAVDPASGGKAILTYNTADSTAVTPSGEDVPGAIVHGMPFNYRYKFNDEGKIYFMEQNADSTVMLGMVDRAMAYSQKRSGVAFLASSDNVSWSATANCLLAMTCALLAAALVTLWSRLYRRGPILLEHASF